MASCVWVIQMISYTKSKKVSKDLLIIKIVIVIQIAIDLDDDDDFDLGSIVANLPRDGISYLQLSILFKIDLMKSNIVASFQLMGVTEIYQNAMSPSHAVGVAY